MKFFTKEVKIALTAIFGILVLFYGLQFLKGLNIFSNTNTYYLVFNDVSGLSASSPVYANGYKVGVVERIDYNYNDPNNIVAVVGLDKAMRIPVGSRAPVGHLLYVIQRLVDFCRHSGNIHGAEVCCELLCIGENSICFFHNRWDISVQTGR